MFKPQKYSVIEDLEGVYFSEFVDILIIYVPNFITRHNQ
jgi:hypothetical protein